MDQENGRCGGQPILDRERPALWLSRSRLLPNQYDERGEADARRTNWNGCAEKDSAKSRFWSTLRGGAVLNQNQIARLLGFDRTVVHRVIRTLIQEGLASERRAESGRALLVRLTAKGNKYRERLIKERRAAEEKLREVLTSEEIASLLGLLKVVAELQL